MDVYRQGSEVVEARARPLSRRLPSSGNTAEPRQLEGTSGHCGTYRKRKRRRSSRIALLHAHPAPLRCSTHRFLLIFIVVSQLCVRPVPVNADNTYTPNVARIYRLQAKCSGKQVSVVTRKVTAQAKLLNDDSILEVESIHSESNATVHVRIKSVKYKTYICFNSRGKLRGMDSGHRRRCLFTEILTDDNYTKFRLATGENWFIGFRKDGRPINGRRRRHRSSECYKFLKIPDNNGPKQGPMASMSDHKRMTFVRKLHSGGPTRVPTRAHSRAHPRRQR